MAEVFEKDQVVNGVSFFEGTIDGKDVKSGTLFILQELDSKHGTAKGQRTVEKRCDSADVIKRIMHLEYPLKCRVVYEERVGKNTEKLVVIDCRPLGSAKMPPEQHQKAA